MEEKFKTVLVFMACEELEPDEYEMFSFGFDIHFLHEMKFNSSFDWLMPVVRKLTIESNRPSTYDDFQLFLRKRVQKALIYKANAFYVGGTAEELLNEVVEVINWYNQNVKQQP